MSKSNKSVTITICWIFIIVFSVLLVRYILSELSINVQEGLENNEVSENIIVTLHSEDGVENYNKVDVGNGIPAIFEYQITSASTDGTFFDVQSTTCKANIPQQVVLNSVNTTSRTDSNLELNLKKQNSFVVLSPKIATFFPSSFTLHLENNVNENKMQFDFWGDTLVNQNEARPLGNMNTLINPQNIQSYTNGIFTNTVVESSACLTKSRDECVINRVNLGKNIINVIQSGDIFDNKGVKIGTAKKMNRRNDVSMDTIEITIENYSGATGLLLYIGHATKV
jgi:hypothetical protein